MDGKSLEFKVGLTIFCAAVILIFGIMWFQGFELGRPTYIMYARFPMVGGIGKGDEVNINGVEKGEVRKVELRERDVMVTMKIDADVQVPADSRVSLQSIGVMGERIVTIQLGASETILGPHSTLQGSYDPGISEALAHMGNLMADLRTLTEDIKEVAAILTGDENLRKTMENLAAVTGELKDLMDESAPDLRDGVGSFKRSADRVDDLLARNAGKLDSVFTALDTASRDLPELFEKIEAVTETLTRVVARLEESDNTLGALIQDRELLDKLERAITSLDNLVTDIKANPKKYLKVEVF
jgi:phospholipid/cholesterol/gamma-HCH transport system substrate-binding protein